MIKDNNKPKFSFIESETKNTDNNISEKPIEEINEIEYEMTDHYQITKYFLQHREKVISEILD